MNSPDITTLVKAERVKVSVGFVGKRFTIRSRVASVITDGGVCPKLFGVFIIETRHYLCKAFGPASTFGQRRILR